MSRPFHGGRQSPNTHWALFRRIVVVLNQIGRHFGLAVALVSLAIILSFTVMEFLDYRHVNIDMVAVDRSRGDKLTVLVRSS
jgi:hypothetical protein